RMLTGDVRADQRPRQLNGAVCEADGLQGLDLDAPRDTRGCTLAFPRQRSDLAGGVALKLDPGFDRGRDRSARTGEEAVAVRRIQRPNLSGFIERDELVRPGEFIPHLEICEGIRCPPIHAGVFTKDLLV